MHLADSPEEIQSELKGREKIVFPNEGLLKNIKFYPVLLAPDFSEKPR